jgi:predicted TIM-barrel fold metal-dependent hydrolase
MMDKIDVHVHVGKGNPLLDEGVATTNESTEPAFLLRRMDEFRVKKAIILALDIPGCLVSNDYVASLQKEHPGRFVGAACVNPTLHKDWGLAEVQRCFSKLELNVLKLMPPYQFFHAQDARMAPVYEFLEDNGAALMFHTGITDWPKAKLEYCRPLDIDSVATDFPKLKIIMSHCGDPWFADTRDVLFKNRNVYADFSGMAIKSDSYRNGAYLQQFFDDWLGKFPVDRVLFGTDWPFVEYGVYEDAISTYKMPKETLKRLGMGEQEAWERILFKNAASFL